MDLKSDKLDRVLAPTDRSDAPLAFEFLHLHMQELQQLKFSMLDKEGQKLKTIDLVLSSAGRASRSGPFALPPSSGATPPAAANELSAALKLVGKMAERTAEVHNHPDHPRTHKCTPT